MSDASTYLAAFLCGGILCLIGQILIDKTKLTPARILVLYVVVGVILGATGLYGHLVELCGALPIFRWSSYHLLPDRVFRN